jgi:nicotinate-nucleotide adenylyltransferase
MKLGVFGGTFDPVHNGHLAVADEVISRLSMDQVLFVPAGQPYLKAAGPISPAEHRVNMVRLAIADRPNCEVSTMEIERVGPTYTRDTIAELRARMGSGDELFFILSWSSLNELPRWKEPGRIIELCRLVAVPRPGYPRPDLEALDKSTPGLKERVIVLEGPQVDISASDIRERVGKGLPISGLVPEVVEGYIREKGLYRTSY